MVEEKRDFIPELEIPDAQVKWNFSHFDGREDTFNAEGDHNFTLIIPEHDARELIEQGWTIKEMAGYEEGDPPEFLLKCKISFKFEAPKIYLLKGNRKMRADQRDLVDIKRSTVERLDVILQPSRWVNGPRTGISAYVKEMYAVVKESRFAAQYADYEEI